MVEETFLVERPKSLSHQMEVPQKVLCGPGPTNMYPRVKDSLSLPLLGHLHKEFTKILDDIQVCYFPSEIHMERKIVESAEFFPPK